MPTPDRPHEVDALDAGIVEMFAAEPRVGVLECSRRLGVARGTVQARLDRLARDGVIRGWGPEVDPAAMGYAVTAFVTLEIRQHHPERAATTPSPSSSPPSPRCSRRTPPRAPATCWCGSWRGPTPTSSG